MAKVTLERYNCDVCEQEGERYTLSFPDGIKVLDRCERHAKKIIALRDEAGEFTRIAPNRRNSLKVSTPEDIARQRARRR
jgi:hypothetical protein